MSALRELPPHDEMYTALCNRDSTYEGVFVAAIRTTGIFCRPRCPARKPNPENVRFFGAASEALAAGFRPCKRCRPLEPAATPPPWLQPLVDEVEARPGQRLTDADLRARDLDPVRVRRWFQREHGMTFQAYARARRLANSLEDLARGAPIADAAGAGGFQSESGFRSAFANLFGAPPRRTQDAPRLAVRRMDCPLGSLVVGAMDSGVALLEFADRKGLEGQVRRAVARLGCVAVSSGHTHLDRLELELGQYFAGDRRDFEVPLVIAGTPFQEAVWGELQAIPFGETRSYDDLAQHLGKPGAQRAVGRANGDNRLSIVVPCHRVVRSDGSLSGYGGGVWRKQRLLDLEH